MSTQFDHLVPFLDQHANLLITLANIVLVLVTTAYVWLTCCEFASGKRR
jgi:hypothetical protein